MLNFFLFDVRFSRADFLAVLLFRLINIALVSLLTFAVVGSAALALKIIFN